MWIEPRNIWVIRHCRDTGKEFPGFCHKQSSLPLGVVVKTDEPVCPWHIASGGPPCIQPSLCSSNVSPGALHKYLLRMAWVALWQAQHWNSFLDHKSLSWQQVLKSGLRDGWWGTFVPAGKVPELSLYFIQQNVVGRQPAFFSVQTLSLGKWLHFYSHSRSNLIGTYFRKSFFF